MVHGKSTKNIIDNASKIKAKLGMWMFILYTSVYAGFILITVINPSLMSKDVGNLNLAIVYGLGLIVLALILALIYNFLCTKYEKKLNSNEELVTEDKK